MIPYVYCTKCYDGRFIYINYELVVHTVLQKQYTFFCKNMIFTVNNLQSQCNKYEKVTVLLSTVLGAKEETLPLSTWT